MKKALLYLLLFSYTTLVLKPVFPTIADTAAHIFWYSEHMATVHFENGKYHVHYEYQQAANNNSPAKDAALLKVSTDNEHINSGSFEYLLFPVTIITTYPNTASSFASAATDSIYPPPRA